MNPTSNPPRTKRWGETPWLVDFRPSDHPLPETVDFAVVGGGFTGLSAAARLAKLAPEAKIAVFESESIGAGSSGHSGGIALADTAAGDMPGLGDVLAGLSTILQELDIACDLALPGVWEISRSEGKPDSPIVWTDSGELRAQREVPGGTVNPGKLLSGLAEAAIRRGALVHENARIEALDFRDPLRLTVQGKQITAHSVLLATNAESLELNALAGIAEPKFTLALATDVLTDAQLRNIGLDAGGGKPFYTVDLPYLWGRLLHGNRIIFGSGLVNLKNWRELLSLDVASGDAARLTADLERRVRNLHPELRRIKLTHRWGGPILIAEGWEPVFRHHPNSERVLVLGAYSGHGVALSVYLGSWAAEVMLQRRALPNWPSAAQR